MLNPGPLMKIEILFDLALAPSRSGLIQRKLQNVSLVGHDDAHERTVLGGDVLVVEAEITMKTEDPGVPLGPFVHPSRLDVSHDMVDPHQAGAGLGRAQGKRHF